MVYITSDLFGPSTSRSFNTNIHTTQQNSTAMPHTAGLGKRKRVMDQDAAERKPGPVQHPCTQHQHTGAVGPQRPSAMCWNISSASSLHHTANHNMKSNNSGLTYPAYPPRTAERRPTKQMKRPVPQIALTKSTSHLMDTDPDFASQPVPTIRPCHACNSAPKRKKDLDSYLDCRRCSERTCYICARECIGGCGKTVCKTCTVEVGEEGDAWCLDCYSRNLSC